MICPECNESNKGLTKDGYCDICNKRIIKRSKGQFFLYKIFDLLRLHKHDWKMIEHGQLKTKHGEFTFALYKCSKCPARDYSVSGFIDNIEKWERHHGFINE